MTESVDYHIKPIKQLGYLMLVAIGCVIVFYGIAQLVIAGVFGKEMIEDIKKVSLNSPQQVIDAFKLLMAIGTSIGMFLAPAIFFSRFIVYDTDEYLKPRMAFSWLLVPLVLAIMVFSTPLIEFLANLNQQLALPQFLKGVERWMLESEKDAARMVELILQVDTTGHYIISLLVMALLPAICEEFFFRGVMQTIFMQWTRNTHAAVWITAIVFSALHLQFFGFLPRVLLGVLFGYMVAYSGSIWTSVWAHFINNGSIVMVTYLYENKKANIDPNNEHFFNYTVYIISLIIVLFLLWIYKNKASGEAESPDY